MMPAGSVGQTLSTKRTAFGRPYSGDRILWRKAPAAVHALRRPPPAVPRRCLPLCLGPPAPVPAKEPRPCSRRVLVRAGRGGSFPVTRSSPARTLGCVRQGTALSLGATAFLRTVRLSPKPWAWGVPGERRPLVVRGQRRGVMAGDVARGRDASHESGHSHVARCGPQAMVRAPRKKGGTG